jgi:predicted transcriptional regulator
MRMKCQEARGNPLPKNGEIGNGRKGKESGRDSTRLSDRSNTYTLRRLARDNPEAKQQDIAKMFGVSQPYVSQVISKTSESEETIIPDHINGNSDKADYNKLPAELREKVAALHHQSITKRNNLSATRFQYFDRLTSQGIIAA